MAPVAASQDARSSAVEAESYYKVLDVSFEATQEEIKTQYHKIVRTLHPDRRRPGDVNHEVLNKFHQVQSAWRCLSDPTRRLMYDLRNFDKTSTTGDGVGCAKAELNRMQQDQAEKDISNMQHTIENVLRREQKKGGVIIKQALYGDLRLRPDRLQEGIEGKRTILREDLIGPVIDVTMPVQFLVEQHTVVLQGGAAASKADLPGFYNPCPLETDTELSLYVCYEFKGHMHEVLVGDHDMLSLPLRQHKQPAGKHLRGPFAPANIIMLRSLESSPVHLSSSSASSSSEDVSRMRSAGLTIKPARVLLTPLQAFNREVDKYRFASLKAYSKGDPTPFEFLCVAVASGLAVAVAASWAVNMSPRGG
mmetsp:Transcript_129337/g.241947  ORF Transcript_129337/g.241947 Transcript_129337/m.241947 type:complete len:364 (-) Transcript_129337:81-1172(-)